MKRSRSAFGILISIAATLVVGCYGGPWPASSDLPLRPLPALQASAPAGDFRFAVFGDQRALADGEWQRMIERIDLLSQRDSRLRLVIDTGDIVDNGVHRDQFLLYRDVMGRVTDTLPVWIGVGNHELNNNRSATARESMSMFLSQLEPGVRPDRLYYEKELGNGRFLFLDSNDLVYVGETEAAERGRRRRADEQMAWLTTALQRPHVAGPTVVVVHHPFLQTSVKHRETARTLWSERYRGRMLGDILLDGGVDLVLVGHTHTYERFKVTRSDGAAFHLINVSGRPRNAALWFGASTRRAKKIDGVEREWFRQAGWEDLERFHIEQRDVMIEKEVNQFAVVTVDGDALRLEVYFDGGEANPWRKTGSSPLN